MLPDPARLPSSHQGQKIHRLLLGIPCPGSPPGTARYLPKKQPLASPECHRNSFPSPAPSDAQLTGKCHREFIFQRKQHPPAQPGQLPPGKAEPVLELHFHKTPVSHPCPSVTAHPEGWHYNPEGSWHCSSFYNAGFSGRFPTPKHQPMVLEILYSWNHLLK